MTVLMENGRDINFFLFLNWFRKVFLIYSTMSRIHIFPNITQDF